MTGAKKIFMGVFIFLFYTPLNISHVRNGTTFGCPTRDLRATVTDKSIK
jgi:hypothetical protein